MKCGMDNQLGRVFCTSCGTKLDLSRMSTQTIADSNKESWLSLHWQKLVFYPVLIIILLPVGFMMWPRVDVIGTKGTQAGNRKIEIQIAALANLKTGQKSSYLVSEEDLNSYFQTTLVKQARVSSMSVNLSKGLVIVRMAKVFYDLGAGKTKIPLALSIDAKCVPVGGKLRIGQAWVGHLKLAGPLVKIAEKAFSFVFASEPKLANLNGIEEITVDDGKLSVTVVKK